MATTPVPRRDFHVFTSLRYDPLLLTSAENSRPELSFVAPSPFYMLVYHRDRLLEAAQHFEYETVSHILSDGPALHESLLKEVKSYFENGGKDEPLKVRLSFDKIARMTVEFAPIAPVKLETLYPPSLKPPASQSANNETSGTVPWALKIDTAPTPSSPFTLLKTSVRDMYNTSRARALPQNPQNSKFAEVILYNECDELTEGSITSVYLYRGGRWVTPPVGVPAGSFDATTLKSITKANGEEERWDEGELRKPFAGRWGHSVRSAKVGSGGQRGTTRRWALSKGMCMEEPVSVNTVQVGEGAWVSNGVVGFGFGTVVE